LIHQAIADRVVDREVRSKITISEDAIRAFYEEGVDVQARELQRELAAMGDEKGAAYQEAANRLALMRKTNLERLVRPEQARAHMLVLFTKDPKTRLPLPEHVQSSKKERIERLRTRVKNGESFVALATEFSEEPDAARNRAEYLATKEQITLPELKKAIFELPLNEVSEVIETDLGFYLVQVLERTPGGKVPMDEAREDIRKHLVDQEADRRLPSWFEGLKVEYGVQLMTRAGEE
jgi:hypothetical protein